MGGLYLSVAQAKLTPAEEYKAIKAEATVILSAVDKIRETYIGLMNDEQAKSLMSVQKLLAELVEPRPGNYVLGYSGSDRYCRDHEESNRTLQSRLALIDGQRQCLEQNIFECNLIKTVIVDEINCKAKAFFTNGSISEQQMATIVRLKSEIGKMKMVFEFVSPTDSASLRKFVYRLEGFTNDNSTGNFLQKISFGVEQSPLRIADHMKWKIVGIY